MRLDARMDLTKEWTDDEVRALIDEEMIALREIPVGEKRKLKRDIFNELRGFGVVQDFLEDEDISEIMINGPEHIFIERNGVLLETDRAFLSAQKLEEMVQRIAGRMNRSVNTARPIADLRLADGSRVNVVLAPVSVDGTCVTIRKFLKDSLSIEELIERKSLTKEAAEFLQTVVKARYNILISGGTGSGKTTFLNAISAFIPEEERVITIEDAAELHLQGIPNLVRLEMRPANLAGEGEISMRDLVKTALRMRPTRILIGETRDGAAADLLASWNTGHEGSISTIHANTASDALARFETLVMMGSEMPLAAIRAQIASAVDIVIQLGRFRDHTRRVQAISEVVGMEDGEIILQPLFLWKEGEDGRDKETGGSLIRIGAEMNRTEKFRMYGG
ncbi:MAG: CpaF family protein [Lachnospiraceae bacterium]|nr:CpaF family protein [Lachnospiraceae bacterium]